MSLARHIKAYGPSEKAGGSQTHDQWKIDRFHIKTLIKVTRLKRGVKDLFSGICGISYIEGEDCLLAICMPVGFHTFLGLLGI